jgi:outer membrane protein assembly factor BamB
MKPTGTLIRVHLNPVLRTDRLLLVLAGLYSCFSAHASQTPLAETDNLSEGLIASPEDGWPQWRGPRRDGISGEKGLLAHWPAGGPRLLWKAEGIGRGWTSPVLTGGAFFITGDLGANLVDCGMLIMARDGSNEGEDKGLGWQKPWDQAFLLALDTRTGKEVWKGRRGSSRIAHGVPTLWEHDGKVEIVSEAGDVVQGFDAQTGERLWSGEVIGEGKVPSTVIGEGLVFTAGGWGGKETIKAFRLGGKGDLKEAQLVWQQKKGMPKVPSLLYWKPHLFAVTDNGMATCLKAATGEIVWQERLEGKFSASPVFAEGRVYFLSDDGETTVIEAGSEFKVLAKNPLGEKVQASMGVSQGHLFIRTENNLICIGSK